MAYNFIICKKFERQKFLALKFNGKNYEEKILINQCMKEDLNWWKTNTTIGSNLITNQNFCIEIFPNASLLS